MFFYDMSCVLHGRTKEGGDGACVIKHSNVYHIDPHSHIAHIVATLANEASE